MEIKAEIKVQEDKLLESLTDEEKKQRLAQEVANKLLRDIQFELYMAAIDGGQIKMISREEAYDLAYRLRNTYIIVPKAEVKHFAIEEPLAPVEVAKYANPIFNEAADAIEELIDALIDVCAENSAYEAANEMQKEKLVKADQRILRLIKQRDEYSKQFDALCKKTERADDCINEISDQFERGKCSNDYVEDILKEYYENE